ncbi:rhodanese-like domain-containing protein [Paenibacillus pini]|uniref:Rhodanese domain protein n=1 Tax=Paenibacillus pini JCM 16418 TaxID=1236976 RepID=W7YSV2_9BACL|nr:rhodanese-like domain-containing protein [Paenibacillus pini]GAF07711.1 rhodanese domain protein [Paenibacillus pini JCM 16418]
MAIPQWKEVSTEEVEAIIKTQPRVQLIDVRELAEYREEHIKEVTLIPLSQLEVRHDEIDRNQETIVICRSGNRSSQACEFLASHGHTKLSNMTGGMLAWQGNISK